MATKTISTRLPPDMVSRLEEVAQRDRRSVAQVIALLVERGLPAWEAEIQQRTEGTVSSSPKGVESPKRVAEDIVQQSISHVAAASRRKPKRE